LYLRNRIVTFVCQQALKQSLNEQEEEVANGQPSVASPDVSGLRMEGKDVVWGLVQALQAALFERINCFDNLRPAALPPRWFVVWS